MSAAILQGVPATTLDTDIWIDLPERQYVRILNLARELGASVLAATVLALSDESIVNFVYHIDGLHRFEWEYRRSLTINWMGQSVHVLPLHRIIKSKQVVGRPKDIAHLPLLKLTLDAIEKTKRRKGD